MFNTLRRSLPAALLVGGMLVVSATTGAVAAGMITGKQIKNGTVTSADLKNNNVSTTDVRDGTLLIGDFSATAKSALQGATGPAGAPGAPGLSGLELVTDTGYDTSAGSGAALSLSCPAGKKAISITGEWFSGVSGTAGRINSNLAGGWLWGINTTGSTDHLIGYLLCANVS